MTSIGENAFSGCSSLRSVVIPDTVQYIEKYAFYGCKCLTDITIPNGVTKIYDWAFYNCDMLQHVSIPDSVTHIADCVFSGCKRLKRIEADVTIFSGSELKIIVLATYLHTPENFSAQQVASCQKYLLSQRKWVLRDFSETDRIQALKYFVNSGKITKSNVDESFLIPAIEANDTRCVAFLQEWKNKHILTADT